MPFGKPIVRPRIAVQPAHAFALDPPWFFDDPLPGKSRGAGRHYNLLTIDQLIACDGFKLPPIAPVAIMFMWRVGSMQREALELGRAWGWEHKSEIVWLKLTKNNKRWFGMGRTVRNEHETCLIFTRGKGANALIMDKGIRSTFEAPVPVDDDGEYIHSAKPECFYTDIVQKLVKGPWAEMFGRRQRLGWQVYGDQADLFAPAKPSQFVLNNTDYIAR